MHFARLLSKCIANCCKLQKLMLARKEAAAREAALKEEAAAARGEAEAAAQLVHALKPKGDLALGTLWTQVQLQAISLICPCQSPLSIRIRPFLPSFLPYRPAKSMQGSIEVINAIAAHGGALQGYAGCQSSRAPARQGVLLSSGCGER